MNIDVILVAQDCHHSGDGRFPGEEAWWRGRALHRVAHAGLPGKIVVLSSATWERCVCLFNRTWEHNPVVLIQPPQFKLDPRLARMLGIHTQTRPVIIQALWQYVKTHKLQDPHEREFINCDKYLQQVSRRITWKIRRLRSCSRSQNHSKMIQSWSVKLGGSSFT